MRRFTLSLGLSVLFTTAALGACVAPSSDETDSSQAAERWNDRNNPAFVDSSFVYDVGRLSLSGKTNVVPTPSDYWATYRDNINVRWDAGELSPAEKYEKAFGVSGLALEVSRRFGIRSQTSRPMCTRDNDCAGLGDGSACAIARGDSSGRCIPTWFGICPGWASSAFMEPAPRAPVTKNGVTFYPGDLEALMSLIYDQADMPTKFIGGRCNLDRLPTDDHGRVIPSECRDLNPGALHVILANKVGARKESFVVERIASLEVWNQPVRGYRVTNAEGGHLKEIAKDAAARLVSGGNVFSPDAKRFFHVQLDLDWIAEARPARTSHVDNAASYTRTDHVEYVLETDAQGKILGGEYVGASREEHPDFAWWPTARPSGRIGVDISYENVKALNDRAAAGGGDGGGTDVEPPDAGPIPESVLNSASKFEVVVEQLNCRSGAGTANPVVSRLVQGDIVTPISGAAQPRVATAPDGKLWVLVQAGANQCYASAQYQYLAPR